VARDNVSPGATPDAYASFHVTNVVVPPLVRGYEKEELAMTQHFMWQKPTGRIVSKRLSSHLLALYLAEMRH
jgi:hypothetical protein